MSDGAMDKYASFVDDNSPAAPTTPSILSLFSLKGRTAIITGAGAGIGLAVAQAYAEAGANIAITYNRNEGAHQAAKEIESRYNVKCE